MSDLYELLPAIGGGKLGDKANKVNNDIMKIASEEKPIEYVVEGATLECSLGTSKSKLATRSRKRIYINDHLQANVKDCKANYNVKSFGRCCRRSKKPKCTPSFGTRWIGGKDDVIVDGAPALLSTATLKCKYGGTIKISDSGQSERSDKTPWWMIVLGVISPLVGAALLTRRLNKEIKRP
jgi:hypothetical protein